MIPDGRATTYVRAIEQNMNAQEQLVCCIVPSNKKDCYDAIKKLYCISRPGNIYDYLGIYNIALGWWVGPHGVT